ncbi:MAG: C39 family peptidase [Nocardioides sp.]
MELVAAQVRCATFQGQQYCLHVGWTDEPAETLRADLSGHLLRSAAAVSGKAAHTSTGDLDLAAGLRATAAMSPDARARAERRELTQAARAAAKVADLRRTILGTGPAYAAKVGASASPSPSPTSSPSPTISPSSTASPTTSATKSAEDYPQSGHVLKGSEMLEQHRSYWCGPTSMQAIAWGWSGSRRSQRHWAKRLGTTTSGTSITDIVRVVNSDTGWDKKKYAGPYVVLDIKKWSYAEWYLLMMRHIHDYRAPVVLHPILLKKYFPYLDDDASGHYQVGRGYRQRGDKPNLLGYFEPWNQQRFDPSEPFIDRVQWRRAYLSYRANKAHYLHNVGV